MPPSTGQAGNRMMKRASLEKGNSGVGHVADLAQPPSGVC